MANLNDDIKDLKQEILKMMLSDLGKGRLNKNSALVGFSVLVLLQMADAYTTVHPIVFEPKLHLAQ